MEEHSCKNQFSLGKFYFSICVTGVSLMAFVLLVTQLGSEQMFDRLQNFQTAGSVVTALLALSATPIYTLWIVLSLAALAVFLWSLFGVYNQVRLEEFKKAIYKLCTF